MQPKISDHAKQILVAETWLQSHDHYHNSEINEDYVSGWNSEGTNCFNIRLDSGNVSFHDQTGNPQYAYYGRLDFQTGFVVR